MSRNALRHANQMYEFKKKKEDLRNAFSRGKKAGIKKAIKIIREGEAGQEYPEDFYAEGALVDYLASLSKKGRR